MYVRNPVKWINGWMDGRVIGGMDGWIGGLPFHICFNSMTVVSPIMAMKG